MSEVEGEEGIEPGRDTARASAADPGRTGADEAQWSDDAWPAQGDGRASIAMNLASPLAGEGGAGDPLAQVLMARLFPTQIKRPKIGRFDLLEFLGEGGMGSVYLAYDDRLDRRVAIKFLRAADGHDEAQTQAQARLLREAQALARLSHPNIVAVHEVWEEEGRVYVAMEYVEGPSLAAWQAEPRPWRELLVAYAGAGEGLAAAHAAGLVHRDFKPHNAIRRGDGVVKVLDFGLARYMSDETGIDGPAPTGGGSLGAAELAATLTRTGAIMGTPVYMAPEQHEGAPADHRSDQYSFCVALWEGLYGALPFPSGSLAELRAAVLSGRRSEPAEARGAPGWVRRVLERGMSLRPDDRYPAMSALLRDLGRDPARRRRRALTIAGGITLTILGGLGVAELRAQSGPQACAREEIARALWVDERREATRAGVVSAAIPAAEATWTRLAPRLDAYADALAAMRGDACESHRRGLHSDALYDLRVACLDRREASFVRLTDLLAASDREATLLAPKALAELPPIRGCGDTEALAAERPPPDDPADRAAVAKLRLELARAEAEEAAGKYAEAEARASAVSDAAAAIDYPPLEAEAALRLGSVGMQRRSADASARLDAALWTALRTEHRSVAAEAAAKRIYARLEIDDRTADVRETIALAAALVGRRGAADWRTRWLLANNSAIAREHRGRLGAALTSYREALALIPRSDDGVYERAATLQNMAPVQVRLGERAAGEAAAREALAEFRALYGPEHPSTAAAESVLASILSQLGRRAEAEALLGEAIAHAAADAGGGGVAPSMYLEAARLALGRGDHREALAACARGEALIREAGGPASPWELPFAAIRARVAAAEGDPTAMTLLERLDPAVRAAAPGYLARQEAEVAWALGRPAEAAAILERHFSAAEAEASEGEARLLLARAQVASGAIAAGEAALRGLLGEARVPAEADSKDKSQGTGSEGEAILLYEPEHRARAHMALAEVESRAGRLAAAITRADQALAELAGFDDPSLVLGEARELRARLGAGADADATPSPPAGSVP